MNCHAATVQPINIQNLKKNKDELFNSEFMHAERQMMLDNKRTKTCENSCWIPEEKGIESVRERDNGKHKTHTSIQQFPEILDIAINTQCSLTCLYCCNDYSSAWRNDITRNGNYNTDDTERYTVSSKNLLLNKIPKKYKETRQKLLLSSIIPYLKSPTLKLIQITGGEPLLNNEFYHLFKHITDAVQIEIYTGLGITSKILENILNEIKNSKNTKNVKFVISAETTNNFYNFVRHGSTWNEFIKKVNMIKNNGFDVTLHTTLCNVTLIDFYNFASLFNDTPMEHCFVSTPEYLAPYVIDDQTKEVIADKLHNYPSIINAMEINSTEHQRLQCGIFLREFASRRNISLEFLPNTFRNWLEI